jgi:acyl-CoA thioesterase
MTHPSFVDASTWSFVDGDTHGRRFRGSVDASWLQGRGAFGGLLSAGLVRCLRDTVVEPGFVPRTLTVHFCAPAREGAIDVVTRIERQGVHVAHLTARILQDDKPVVVATSTFASARTIDDAGAHYDLTHMPQAPAWSDVEPVPVGVPLMPVFTQHFEYRFCMGPGVFSGGDEPLMGAWVRPRDVVTLDAPLVAALLDTLPPAVFSRLSTPRAAASVDLTVHFCADLHDVPASLPLLVTASSRTARDGYTDQQHELWTQDGKLLAHARQLVALL